jgi:hypothetical protein
MARPYSMDLRERAVGGLAPVTAQQRRLCTDLTSSCSRTSDTVWRALWRERPGRSMGRQTQAQFEARGACLMPVPECSNLQEMTSKILT